MAQVNPNAFNVTAHYSETVQRTMVVTNSGYSNLNLQIVQYNGGFVPASLGTFEYLPLPANDVKTEGPLPGMLFNGNGTPPPATRAAAYIYHGPNETIQLPEFWFTPTMICTLPLQSNVACKRWASPTRSMAILPTALAWATG